MRRHRKKKKGTLSTAELFKIGHSIVVKLHHRFYGNFITGNRTNDIFNDINHCFKCDLLVVLRVY